MPHTLHFMQVYAIKSVRILFSRLNIDIHRATNLSSFVIQRTYPSGHQYLLFRRSRITRIAKPINQRALSLQQDSHAACRAKNLAVLFCTLTVYTTLTFPIYLLSVRVADVLRDVSGGLQA